MLQIFSIWIIFNIEFIGSDILFRTLDFQIFAFVVETHSKQNSEIIELETRFENVESALIYEKRLVI